MLGIVLAALLQQAAPASALPASAAADPYGYERAECSPLIRSPRETLEACQTRVRRTLAATLGAALPQDLSPETVLRVRPIRPNREARVVPAEKHCETVRSTLPQGAVYSDLCRDGRAGEEDNLRIRLLGNQ
ncbi:MAG: hypothetical protein Q8O54_03115 [Brevundimonas sp.]|nr:hypothetical protein [Brevundimonas sp.]